MVEASIVVQMIAFIYPFNLSLEGSQDFSWGILLDGFGGTVQVTTENKVIFGYMSHYVKISSIAYMWISTKVDMYICVYETHCMIF